MAIEKDEFSDIGSALTITGDNSGYQEATLSIKRDYELLCVTVSSGTDPQKGIGRSYVNVIAPNGDRIDPTEIGKEGQSVYLIKNPQEGEWKISAEGKAEGIQVNATALKRGWRQRLISAGWKASCRACAFLLRALIIALVMHLAGVVINVAIVATVAGTLGLTAGFLEGFLDFLRELLGLNERIDNIMEKSCKRLGYCGPQYYM